jgi:hypothetical protein
VHCTAAVHLEQPALAALPQSNLKSAMQYVLDLVALQRSKQRTAPKNQQQVQSQGKQCCMQPPLKRVLKLQVTRFKHPLGI